MGMTCAGKTGLSLQLAKQFNCEIINFDSTQFYKDFNIGNDKIQVTDYPDIKHHLLSFLPTNYNFSIGEYKEKVKKVIDDVISRKKIPLLVGGSGLYLASFLFSYPLIGKRDEEFAKLYQFTDNKDLFKSLEIIDPDEAKKLHYNDRNKVLRALEIFNKIGKTKTQLLKNQSKIYKYDYLAINLEIEKNKLQERAKKRIDNQFKRGLVDEVIEIIKEHPSAIIYNSFNIIGYRETYDVITKKCTLEEAKEKMLKRTIKYAKRQKTFFNNKFLTQYKFDLEQEKNIDKIVFLIKNFLLE